MSKENIKLFLERVLWGRGNKRSSTRQKVTRIIVICCISAVMIQAIVMLAMILKQYVSQEKKDILYLLESDNTRMDDTVQYLEEITLSIQHNDGIKGFLTTYSYSEESATAQLKTVANLFSERNLLGGQKPFVEKVYLFQKEGRRLYNLYYPTTISEMEKNLVKYIQMNERFLSQDQSFYYEVEDDYVNLCLNLYDEDMDTIGTCIFVLNRSGMEEIYANMDGMEGFIWEIRRGEEVILNKGSTDTLGKGSMEHTLTTGFGLTLRAAVSPWQVYRSLGTTMFIMIIISIGVIFLLALLGYMLVTEVYETQLVATRAQINYLQAQMNPHFLFNVLSMIEMKAAVNGDREVQRMLFKLSGLYQGKIFRKDRYFIPLAEEMEIVDFYLSLQNSRFGDKITYSIEYEGGREHYQACMVPRLSIEPSVENAVCHGLEPKEDNGHIRIRIKMSPEEELLIRIEDDGVGFDPGIEGQNQEDGRHSHVGIENTDKMIKNLCGENYGLEISSTPGKGTTVIVRLPGGIWEEKTERD